MILYGMRAGCCNMAGPLCTACLVPLLCHYGESSLGRVFGVFIWKGAQAIPGLLGMCWCRSGYHWLICLDSPSCVSSVFPGREFGFYRLGLSSYPGLWKRSLLLLSDSCHPSGFLFFFHVNPLPCADLPTLCVFFCLPRLEVFFSEGTGLPKFRDRSFLLCSCFQFPEVTLSDDWMLEERRW